MDDLQARLDQLYEDLAPFDAQEIGHPLAQVYNDLYVQVMNGHEQPVGGITKVSGKTTGRTARLLVGQLKHVR